MTKYLRLLFKSKACAITSQQGNNLSVHLITQTVLLGHFHVSICFRLFPLVSCFFLCVAIPWPLYLLLPPLQTYTRFTGAPLKVHKISNPWQSPSGIQYLCREGNVPGEEWETGMQCTSVWLGKLDRVSVLLSQYQELCLLFKPVMETLSQYHTRSSPIFVKR